MNPTRQLLEGPSDRGLREYPLDRLQEFYAASQPELTIGDYWRILLKRKWTILICALVVVTIAGLASLRITPIYDAVARVSMFGQTSNLLNFSKSQSADQDGAQLSIDTQVRILESNTLALLV